MSLLKISFKNFWSRPLHSGLNILLISLSTLLILGIKQLDKTFNHQIENSYNGIDMVVGAKGSPLQLILSSVMHIDHPVGNIDYHKALELAKHPWIKKTVPISYGDSYKGFRIVGTTDSFYGIYKASLLAGKFSKHPFEVVLGDYVAKQLNLNIGDTFFSTHGLMETGHSHENHPMKVVGILKTTHTVVDQLIVTPLETIWDLHEHKEEDHHDHEHNAHEHEEAQEITALLVFFRNPMALAKLPRIINDGKDFQAALPKYELSQLQHLLGIGSQVITWIAYAILLISGLGMGIHYYKMVQDKAYELALLRSYGASQTQLIKMVLYESSMVALLGSMIGSVLGVGSLSILFQALSSSYKRHIIFLNLPQDIFEVFTLFIGIAFLTTIVTIPFILKIDLSNTLSREK